MHCSVEIHLAAGRRPDPTATAGATCLWVDDADAFAGEWDAAGVGSLGPVDTDWGLHEGSHSDPDGWRLPSGCQLDRGAFVESEDLGALSRRQFLASAAGLASVAAAARWVPAFRVQVASADPEYGTPPNFPPGIALYQEGFQNWCDAIVVDDLWTALPRTPEDVVAIVNWALANSYRIRARGKMHSWSPLTVTSGTTSATKVVLVDTTEGLTSMQLAPGSPASVTVQTGAQLNDLHAYLEQGGYGFLGIPAVGDITVGGALAVDAHGASIPGRGETPLAGTTYGSLSNLVTSLTAVVWDPGTSSYQLRTFDRSDPDAKAFLTHLGRAFLTEVTLRVAANAKLRCQSFVDIPGSELFATPGSPGRSFDSFVESAGRVEAIWFPFTQNPWLKVWSVAPTKPFTSRPVSSPYNYVFSDVIPLEVSVLAGEIISGSTFVTPTFGAVSYDVTAVGLPATLSADIWGPSKDVLLYVKPTTLTFTEQAWAVVTQRGNIQQVASEFATQVQAMMNAYQSEGEFPINGPIEIRVTGLDHPVDVGVPGAEAPVLSAVTPRPDHPEWDVAVWCGILTYAGTPSSFAFLRELETWVFENYSGSYATVRPEWSKGWAFSADAAWSDPTILGTTIPNAFRAGLPATANWDWALATLDTFDPFRIFSNGFLDTLLS